MLPHTITSRTLLFIANSMGDGGLICPRLSLCAKMTRGAYVCDCVCVCVQSYFEWTSIEVYMTTNLAVTVFERAYTWLMHICTEAQTRQRADICIFRLSRAMRAHACVTLTWWPTRWRRAEFPAGRAGSLHSSSGVGASLHRSCHSSGTCRRRARRRASGRRTAGRPPHTPGSRSRSRWPEVGGGSSGKENGVNPEAKTDRGGKRDNGNRWKVRADETTKGGDGGDGGSLRKKIGMDQESCNKVEERETILD